MTTLSKDEILLLAREADTTQGIYSENDYDEYLIRFATLCRADLVAEVERLGIVAKASGMAAAEAMKERNTHKAELNEKRENIALTLQEVDSLKADAERYRELTSLSAYQIAEMLGIAFGNYTPLDVVRSNIDAKIDNAMKRGEA